MDNQDSKPVRRVRYKGTYPKTFQEKYKELQPDKYTDDIEKVMQKGKTPAGMHRSICVDEIIEFLQIKSGQIGLDATLGYGGHSLEMLKCLDGSGQLFATDVDPIELPKTKERLAALGFKEPLFNPRQINFSEVDTLAEESGKLNFVLADLGVSSMQIDNPARGFSLKVDGPLDLRLNPQSGISAAQLLKKIKLETLYELLVLNADEVYAEPIALAIIAAQKNGLVIKTTGELRNIIQEALAFLPKSERVEAVKKACTRCFQALRIEVNNEFLVLNTFLEKLPYVLAPHARVAILSFHSGEDRRVKKAFQALHRAGVFERVAPDPIRPTSTEIFNNPRARSAKLRWAIMGENSYD
jgi:16S rRNA (cytosine1402-N4)-methyltransferase